MENDFDSIISVIMYAPDNMVSFTQAFFRIRIHRIDSTLADKLLHERWAFDLIQMVLNFGWEKITLVTLTQERQPYRLYYQESLKGFKEHKICVELQHVDPEMITNQTTFIRQSRQRAP